MRHLVGMGPSNLALIVIAFLFNAFWLSSANAIRQSPGNGVKGPFSSSVELVARQDASTSTTTSPILSSNGVLNVFQVSLPVLGPFGLLNGNLLTDNSTDDTGNDTTTAKPSCQVTLMEFSFANSFGKPFVGMC